MSNQNYIINILNLKEKKILVVGGGNAAFIKIKTLLKTGANIYVIAKEYAQKTEKMLEEYHISYEKRGIKQQDLDNVFIVFAAAEKDINNDIAVWAQERKILCCKADGTGDFTVPYHEREGNLTVAVSTDGLFPLMGKKICENMLYACCSSTFACFLRIGNKKSKFFPVSQSEREMPIQ